MLQSADRQKKKRKSMDNDRPVAATIAEANDQATTQTKRKRKSTDTDVKQSRFPIGVCVKVKYIRPRYNNLEEWMQNPRNVLVTRHGRVFIGSGDNKHIFHYKASKWANPFKLTEYSLDKSLELYQDHLSKLLEDEKSLEEFMRLAQADEVGCFCDSGNKCHREIIIAELRKQLATNCSTRPHLVRDTST